MTRDATLVCATMAIGVGIGLGLGNFGGRLIAKNDEQARQRTIFQAPDDELERTQRKVRANELALASLRQELREQTSNTAAEEPDEEQEPTEGYEDPVRDYQDPAALERRAAEVRQMWRDAMNYHEQQPTDDDFARVAAPLLEDALVALGEELGFAFVNQDCRTKICVATLMWDTYEAAMAAGMKAVARSRDVNCSVGTILPVPDDPTAPYESNIFYDGCKLRTPEL